MTDATPQVDQIDHVELVVPNRYNAAAWYQAILGLERCPEYEQWADDGGPLMIRTPEGGTKLALFEGDPESSGPDDRGGGPTENESERAPDGGSGGSFTRVAFGADAPGFLAVVDALGDRSDVDVAGREDVVDHDKAWSIYFSDPWGHSLEVTTYQYEPVAISLES